MIYNTQVFRTEETGSKKVNFHNIETKTELERAAGVIIHGASNAKAKGSQERTLGK